MKQIHRGQSLIEILVVMSIILTVLSFLVPAACMMVKAVHSPKGH